MKAKISLDTMTDVNRFVATCAAIGVPVYLTDGNAFKVSAKSMLGALAALEWDDLWCECDEDIFTKILEFVR